MLHAIGSPLPEYRVKAVKSGGETPSHDASVVGARREGMDFERVPVMALEEISRKIGRRLFPELAHIDSLEP